jgi:hypothetical protein
MFCIYCGAPNPDSASFCSTCGKAVSAPVEQATASDPDREQLANPALAPTQVVYADLAPARASLVSPRSHTVRNVTLIVVAIAAVIAVAILFSGPSPQDSLEKAGAAFVHQDALAFDNYVDVQSILGDWTDQAASGWLANNQSSAGDTLITNGLVLGFKSLIVPKLAVSVEQEILNNRTSDQPQANDSDATNYMTSFISSGINNLISSQLTYQGIASQVKSGSDAVLDVRVGSPVSSSPLVVQVKMRRVGDHWRIVAIQNVAGLLAQLHPAPNARSQVSPTDPQRLAELAKDPPDAATPSPTNVPPPPPVDKKSTEASDDDPIGDGGFITPPSQEE